jgi:hypothetical protein
VEAATTVEKRRGMNAHGTPGIIADCRHAGQQPSEPRPPHSWCFAGELVG